MLRVKQGGTFLETYRAAVTKGSEALVGIKAIKKSRLEHVLLELEKSSSAGTMAAVLSRLVGSDIECVPFQEKTTLEVRDVDPMVEGPELLQDIAVVLKVDPKQSQLRTMRQLPLGSQMAISRRMTSQER